MSALRSGLVWTTLTVIASRAMVFVALLVLAHLLVPSEFGTVAAIVTFLALIQLGSDLGMQATVVFEQERGVTERIHTAFTLNVVLAALVTVVGVLISPWIAAFFHLEGETNLFRLACLNLLLAGFGNIHDGLLLRELDFRRRVRPQVAQGLVQSVASIALALAGLGAAAMVIGSLAGTAAKTVTLWRTTSFRPHLTARWSVVRSMVGYGGAASALSVVSVVAGRSDALVVGRVLGDEALGLYTIALRLPELLLFNVAGTLSLVAFPALSRMRSEGEVDVHEAAAQMSGYLALYALPVAAGMALLSGPIVAVLFADPWAAAAPVLTAVALTSGLGIVIFPLGDAGKAAGKQATLVLVNVVHVPLMIGAMVLASPSGIVGVAWAGVGATVAFVALFLVWARYSVGIPLGPVVREARPAVAAAIGVALALGALRLLLPDGAPLLVLVLGIVLGGAAAGAGLWVLGGPAARDLLRRVGVAARRRTSGASPSVAELDPVPVLPRPDR